MISKTLCVIDIKTPNLLPLTKHLVAGLGGADLPINDRQKSTTATEGRLGSDPPETAPTIYKHKHNTTIDGMLFRTKHADEGGGGFVRKLTAPATHLGGCIA